jgi:hypothetical protein
VKSSENFHLFYLNKKKNLNISNSCCIRRDTLNLKRNLVLQRNRKEISIMGSQTLITSLVLLALISLAAAQFKQPRKFHINLDDKSDDTETAAATLQQYRARQAQAQPQQVASSYEYSDEEEENVPAQSYSRPSTHAKQYVPQQQYQQQSKSSSKYTKKQQHQQELDDELEEEEPDRLAILLEKSNFQCDGRTTGYYADDSVGCEVFHYCQDNSKHSWVCPEGFTFHQVHLICMPPSNENICEQSSKYHFVNDYLYKPINMEEHQTKPNITLRYHERYYPENIYTDDRREYDEERTHIRQQVKSKPAYQVSSTPSTYRQQNAYRSPEDINISLQQRRPYFTQTTPRYEEEEEYSYEKK